MDLFTGQTGAIVLASLVFIGIALMALGLRVNMTAGAQGDIQSRLSQYASAGVDDKKAKEIAAQAEKESMLGDRMEAALQGSKYANTLKNDLQRADIKLRPSEFIMLNVASTLGLAAVAMLLSNALLLGLLFGLVGFFAPRLYVSFRISQRMNTFNGQLGDTITMMANALRSGMGISQVMAMIGKESPSPTKDEFARVTREVQIGLPPELALQNMVNRLRSEDLDLMVTAININREVGGSLADILEMIGVTIRERARIQGQIRALTAQQQLSGYVISLLPVLLGIALYMLNPAYMSQMFVAPWICMPICAGIGIVIGFLVMQQIMKIDV